MLFSARLSRTAGALTLVLTLATAGCESLAKPKLVGPGPTDYQRRQAHQFDPYPDKDLLGDSTGTRPLDYLNPPAEPQKARWDQHGLLRRFGGTVPQ